MLTLSNFLVFTLTAFIIFFSTSSFADNTINSPRENLSNQNSIKYKVDLPRILSLEDIKHYKIAFILQNNGDLKEAENVIKKIENPVLLGHLLSLKYLHPTAHRSKFKELKEWMDTFSDHPDAKRIYKLAIRRKPKNATSPAPPRLKSYGKALPASIKQIQTIKIPSKRLSGEQKKQLKSMQRNMRSRLRRGWPTGAKEILTSEKYQKLATPEQFDFYQARIAWSYYIYNKDSLALELASKSAERSRIYLPASDWTAGISAWRLGRLALARLHFERLGGSKNTEESFASAAAFWAFRVNMRMGDPRKATNWLEKTAKNQHNFYGLLAQTILGGNPGFVWTNTSNSKSLNSNIVPPLARAIALIEVGQIERAKQEILQIQYRVTADMAEIILTIASMLDMPSLQTTLGARLYGKTGMPQDSSMYPTPNWVPIGGFKIDPALIFALIRQESLFKHKAKSRRGARGVMQLMPRTAKFIARNTNIGKITRNKLHKPEINIALGQEYVSHLMKDGVAGKNLLFTLAAYNAGPGNLNKWLSQTQYGNDPLLFMESSPSRETRNFMRLVITNYWIYRHKMGQETPSLNQMANGTWPEYFTHSDNGEK